MKTHRRFCYRRSGNLRLGIESLEPRLALAVYTVTNGNDSGPGSLRTAVEAATSSIGVADTIRFASGVTDIRLTSASLDIGDSARTTIQATGVTIRRATTVDVPLFSIFVVEGNLSLVGGRLTGGHGSAGLGGGALLGMGTVKLDGVTIVNNSSSGSGGGVSIAVPTGSLEVNNSTISSNSADGSGGGIFSLSPTTISGSRIGGNFSGSIGGGVYLSSSGTIVGSFVINNESIMQGGGLFIAADFRKTIELKSTTIADNTAGSVGGGLVTDGSVQMIDMQILRNTVAQAGGGIFAAEGNLDINNSTISQNESAIGGGIYNSIGVLIEILDSTVRGNVASLDGGGIFNVGFVSTDRTTISGNRAGERGGGVFNLNTDPSRFTTDFTAINTTISGNQAEDAGGIYSSGNLVLLQSTVAFNRGDTVTGGINTTATEFFINTIVSNNTVGQSANTLPSDIVGTVDTASFNLVGHSGSSGGIVNGVGGNLVGVDPLLGPLRNNGGVTQTHAIAPTSRAVNRGDTSNQFGQFDQRGAARKQLGRADIGAYEVQPTLVKTGNTFVFTDHDNRPNDIVLSVDNAGNLQITNRANPIVVSATSVRSTFELGVAAGDRIVINTGGDRDRVFVDYRRTFPAFSGIITANLGAGSDSLVVSGNANYILNNTSLSISGGVSGRVNHSGVELAILQSGSGNNRVDARAFSGTTVLDGGTGNDVILGGSGRNILIGGLGADRITGGINEDIIIGGRTTLDILAAAFASLATEWASTKSYTDRINRLRGGIGLPAGTRLDSATVPADTEVDVLFGAGGTDWFWAFGADQLSDRLVAERLR